MYCELKATTFENYCELKHTSFNDCSTSGEEGETISFYSTLIANCSFNRFKCHTQPIIEDDCNLMDNKIDNCNKNFTSVFKDKNEDYNKSMYLKYDEDDDEDEEDEDNESNDDDNEYNKDSEDECEKYRNDYGEDNEDNEDDEDDDN